ncbi:unnamed protein product [Paramecium octaurelia]|uniref:B30.2/SPRY domain-containing protein n=1 Tax=Paramecium octaurelia TaxID=43137 RepID=A0A8S1YJT5_PAROT|nr:unnamed protein product [Paramecium octaurelia]
MNILQSKQSQDGLETTCKIHNLEFIAVDLDMSDKSQIKFFCGKCLVDKLNNNKVTTIEQSKERITQMKTQQQEIKIKENQTRLNYYKNILDQIMDFKRTIDDSLEKMYKQIQQYIFPIQKEKQELQEIQYQFNYFEDIKQLSEFYSSNMQKSTKLIEDNSFIDQLTRQFELLFNNAEYFQTQDTFKSTKQTIEDLIDNNVIELQPLLQTNNESRTPSLSRVCINHKKEIIMIDMDSQNKKIEDRFVCVDCISDNPQIKYQTIQNVNKQWIDYNSQSSNIFLQYKQENTQKRYDLFNQIAQMRKNYNQKLNEISDKLISEQFQSINKSKNSNQIKRISIQSLEDEQLLIDLRQLIEKEDVSQNQDLTSLKNKDSIFQKEIENHLESLKLFDQLDIQQSIDILKEITKKKNQILQLSDIVSQISKCTQTNDENNQNQIEFIKDISELIEQAKKYQCQINLFDQTVSLFQQHTNKIEQIQQKILNQTKDQTLSKVLNNYINLFDNNNKQIKKYCNIQQLEEDLLKLTEINKNITIDKTNQLNQMSKQLDENQQEYQKLLKEQQNKNQNQIDELIAKLQSIEKENANFKELINKKIQEITNLKKQNEEDKLQIIKTLEDQTNKQIEEMTKRINQKELEFQKVQRQFDQINQEILEKEKQSKLELEQIKQYPITLLFSNTYKGANCQVTEGGKVVEYSGDSQFYCLCEQAIPKNGKTLFAFKMISGTNFRVGIGFRDIIQKNNYQNSGVGYGSYLIHIQQSIDILKEITKKKNQILQLSDIVSQISKCTQTNDENNQNQIEFIKDISELIEQAKKYQCQINLFDQTVSLFQQHTNKIEQIQQKILNQTKDQTLSKVLNNYINLFDNNNKQIKKYCNIQQLEEDLLKLTEINKNITIDKTNQLNQMSKQLDENQQEYQKLLKEQQNKNQNQIDELIAKLQSIEKENANFKELINQKIQEITNLKKQNEEDKLQIIKTLEDQTNKQIEEMTKRINQKELEFQKVQRQFDQINQEILEKEKQSKLELEQIKQYPITLLFSNTYKGANCQVTEGGKVVEYSGDSQFYCLCEQAIPKNGKTLFAFKMISGTNFRVGIGFRDIIQKNNYQNSGVGYGSYLIRDDGHTYSHHNKDVNSKKLSFSFTTNDVIIIEVSIEHKYIKWTRQNSSQATVLEIETSISQELYPCVFVYNQSKVKILNNIPN